MKSNILDIHNKLKTKEISPIDLVNNAKSIWIKNKSLNSIITPIFPTNLPQFDKDNLLSCILYSLKDNICTKNILTTGGSKFLSTYIPPYDATCYELLQKAKATLISKDSLDEFGLGGVGHYCFTGIVKNPCDPTKITGGSSSGSAVNVKLKMSTFALATDTGDSIRRPASLVGIVGYKPSYGVISRYGVYPYAPSLDHVGILTNYVADCCIVASYLNKKDPKDMTSLELTNSINLQKLQTKNKIKFIVFEKLLSLLDPQYLNEFNKLLNLLRTNGHEICLCKNLSPINEINKIYKILSYMEAYSCYSCLTGLNYGLNVSDDKDNYEQTILKNRSAGFGNEAKKRFTIGAYLTRPDKFIDNVQGAYAIKNKIIAWENALYQNNGDCILMPSVQGPTPSHQQPFAKNNYDDWLTIANFTGSPSITIPFTNINKMPYGITITTKKYDDMNCLNYAYTVEELLQRVKNE